MDSIFPIPLNHRIWCMLTSTQNSTSFRSGRAETELAPAQRTFTPHYCLDFVQTIIIFVPNAPNPNFFGFGRKTETELDIVQFKKNVAEGRAESEIRRIRSLNLQETSRSAENPPNNKHHFASWRIHITIFLYRYSSHINERSPSFQRDTASILQLKTAFLAVAPYNSDADYIVCLNGRNAELALRTVSWSPSYYLSTIANVESPIITTVSFFLGSAICMPFWQP